MWRVEDGSWRYPPLDEAMSEARLREVETYVSRHHNPVTQYIVTCPIMELCLEMEWRPGARVSNRWREQGCLDIVGAWTEMARAAYVEEVPIAGPIYQPSYPYGYHDAILFGLL